MPLDAICLRAVTNELNNVLAGCRVEKVYQPDRDEIVLQTRGGQGGPRRLLLSIAAGSPRVHFIDAARENPAAPPMFCMLLRKHLTGGRLVGMQQPEMERLLDLTFDCTDEMGSPTQKHLILEIMGRNSNLILTAEDGRILDCLRRVDFEMSEQRQVLPGLYYHLPPTQGKRDPFAVTQEELTALLAAQRSPRRLDGWLLDTFGGFSPLVCRELAFCLTGDLDMVRHTVCWISYNAVESTCLFLFSMTYLFSVNAALTLLLLAVAPVILACSFLFSRTVYPLYASLREKLSRMNSVAQENIAGNKTVRAFVREAYENEKFENCNEEYRQANLKANFHWLKFFPYIEGCAQLMGLLSVLFGGLFIIQGKMTAGDLAAFSLMSWGLSEPMRALGTYLNDFQRFLTSAAKVIEIYFARTRIENPEHGRTEGECRGSVEFRGVTVAYPHNSAPTLKDVSFSVTQGQTLAILGATGSGKTTLVDAVTRMLDVSGGTVLVDGVDVRLWDLQALRRRIGMATQRQQQHRVQRARRHLRRRRRPVRPPRGR